MKIEPKKNKFLFSGLATTIFLAPSNVKNMNLVRMMVKDDGFSNLVLGQMMVS